MPATWFLIIALNGLVFIGDEIYDTEEACTAVKETFTEVVKESLCVSADEAAAPGDKSEQQPERRPGPNAHMPTPDLELREDEVRPKAPEGEEPWSYDGGNKL
jgi:hypothetical protein